MDIPKLWIKGKVSQYVVMLQLEIFLKFADVIFSICYTNVSILIKLYLVAMGSWVNSFQNILSDLLYTAVKQDLSISSYKLTTMYNIGQTLNFNNIIFFASKKATNSVMCKTWQKIQLNHDGTTLLGN